jgi:hypothetical protein
MRSIAAARFAGDYQRLCEQNESARGGVEIPAANGRDVAPQAKAQRGQVVPGFAGFLALGALTGFR